MTDACSHTYLQLSRSVQLRNALVQNIVHDLRSPLCSIQGSLDFHESASDVGEAEKHITYARSEAKRMNLVVSDSLDVHRLEAGEIVISPNAYRVTTLAGEAAKAVQTSVALQIQLSTPDLSCHSDHSCLTEFVVLCYSCLARKITYHNQLHCTSRSIGAH